MYETLIANAANDDWRNLWIARRNAYKPDCAHCGRRLDGSTGEAEHEGNAVCLDCLTEVAQE